MRTYKSNQQILQEIIDEAWPRFAKKPIKNKIKKSEKLALEDNPNRIYDKFDKPALLKNGKLSVSYLMRKLKYSYSMACDVIRNTDEAI